MRVLSAVALFLALPLSACDLVNRLQNEKVLAGVVIESPGISSSSPPLEIPGVVVARAFFGEVESGGSAASAVGLSGATVDVVFTPPGGSATAVRLTASGPTGQYGTTSLTSSLAYHPGVAYTFRVQFGGETYTGAVTAPPAATMESPAGTPVPTAQTDSYAAWPSPWTISRQGNDLAIYAVADVAGTGAIDFSSPDVNCTNAPGDDPKAWLNLLVNDTPYRAASFDLPKASCFPAPGTYAVGLTTLRRATGTQVSSNLFLGSGVLVGTTDAVAVLLVP